MNRPSHVLGLTEWRAPLRRHLFRQGLLGFLAGYAFLHPVSMIIFGWLGPQPLSGVLGDVPHALIMSFRMHMLPMGLVFGLVSTLTALVYGYQRVTIALQRDDLARQLALNESYRSELQLRAEMLREQNRKLADLDRANRRATRFMVHDFKTHLGCILGFSELLLEKSALTTDSESLAAVGRIRRQALRMMGAVGDLLDLARLQNRGEVRAEKVPFPELLQEALNDVASLPVHANRVQVGAKHQECPPVPGDRRLLKRVLVNLIGNAFKHNPAGTGVFVDAELSREREEVVFRCRDNGAGIPPAILKSLFKEFGTGESQSEDSTGLGLAFCRAAVEAHGGRIWCESVPGEGSIFCFTVPVGGEETRDERGAETEQRSADR